MQLPPPVAMALAALMQLALDAQAFNVDLHHAVVVVSPTGADDLLFGYSVALTPAQLLVGEPRGEWLNRPDIQEPGALHRCRLDMLGLGVSKPQCSDIRLDMTGNDMTYIGGHSVHHLKNNSMFASTIVTTSAGLALVCGPGWKNQLYRQQHYLMNGLCYSLDWTNLYRQPKPYAPLVERERQGAVVPDEAWPGRTKNVFYYAFGEAGFSAHVSQEAGEVLLGAPGVYSWRGSVVRYRINEAGQLVEKFVSHPDSFEDYGYFGYSVTAGRFDTSRRTPVQYAAGAPRAAHTGKVRLFELPDEAAEHGGGGPTAESTRMSVLQEVFGEQLGEYFGAAVLAEDVNGDGLADLMVGAPLHSTPQAGDQGRVYVHLNLGEGRLRRSEPPLGPSNRPPLRAAGRRSPLLDDPQTSPHGARFGSALAAAGDVNKDGYNDVWVGAPYEDAGRGAVYLFLGSASGLRTSAAQHIPARDVHPNLRSFGFSLAASADVDDNGYIDLAVGAPLSGHAVVLLTRPAARLAPRITSSVTELSFSATSFVLSACLLYTGHRAQPHAAAVVTLVLDGPSGALERAMLQPLPQGRAPARQLQYSQHLQLGRLACTNVTVLIRPSNVDFTTPIDVTMRFNLTDEASRKDRPFCRSCPVLDPTAPTSATLRIPYATGCKDDTLCRPDLKVSAEWHDTALPLVVGSTREVTLRALIRNTGEPAFLARMAVTLPAPLAVARMPPACHAPRAYQARTAASTATRLLCDLANPLGHNKQLLLELPLDVSHLTLDAVASSAAPSVAVALNATSAGAANTSDSVLAIRLPLAAVVDLDVVGRASPELGLLPDRAGTKAVGFTHTFEVRHVGPTWAPGAALRIHVPVKARVGGPRGRIVTLLKVRVLVDRRRVNCTTREVTEAGRDDEEREKTVGVDKASGLPAASGEDVDDWEDLADGAPAGGLRCGVAPALCLELQCPLLLLPPAAVTVDLRLRLLPENLDAVGVGLSAVAVHTKAVVVLPDLPSLPAGSTFRSRPVQLSTLFMRPTESAPVEPWVVGLSVAAGLLLLALLTLALRKAGFFGRKKIPQAGEVPLPGQGIPDDRVPRAADVEADDDTLLTDDKTTAAAVLAADDESVDGALETASDSGMSMHSSVGAPQHQAPRTWLSAG